jgi:hypothetical protein
MFPHSDTVSDGGRLSGRGEWLVGPEPIYREPTAEI